MSATTTATPVITPGHGGIYRVEGRKGTWYCGSRNSPYPYWRPTRKQLQEHGIDPAAWARSHYLAGVIGTDGRQLDLREALGSPIRAVAYTTAPKPRLPGSAQRPAQIEHEHDFTDHRSIPELD